MKPEEILPHRPPFLFVDEIVSLEAQRIRARKKIDPGAEVFKGHFPAFPLMPGVLVCEALAQTGALLVAHLEGGAIPAGKVPVLTRMNNVRFKHMVRPGDTLELEAALKEKLGGAYFLEAAARANGKLAVSLEFACTIAPIPQEQK